MSILIIIYVIAALALALYAFNAWFLIGLYFKQRRNGPDPLPCPPAEMLPSMTVQLPIFNEALVVQRLIDAIVRLDYPDYLLQIQVLDDSTDETTEIAQARVALYRCQGINIELIHRRDRPGFKAGALKNGLKTATGEIIAIFDADFVPEPDFLKRTVPYFIANPEIGIIQTRWGHLNRWYSWLTAAQALALDGHFAIEQTARNRSGFLINFNGTAGLWRRSCIKEAGGWQGDTISEDFDLSYRAQLAGWKCLFLRDVVAPAEIPPQLAAFKRQQFRWAKGSIQCLKKLGWRVLCSRLSWPVKAQALVHISSYLVHPLMVILALITPLLMLGEGTANIRFPLIYLSLVSLGPPFLYAVAQATLDPNQWRYHYRAMPLLVLLGSGIALSNTKAVIEAWLGVGHIFRRTPKFNIYSASDRWQDSLYRLPLDGLIIGELAFGLYSLLGAVVAWVNGHHFAVPFILLYALGFGYVGLQGLWDARQEVKTWLRVQFGQRKRADTVTIHLARSGLANPDHQQQIQR
jgi:cellulose synthase/poly-beta-1,6-N-acetylglucosamine synthase-like glycosyltransferase